MRKPEIQDNLNADRIEQKEGKTEMEQIQELAAMIGNLREDDDNFRENFYTRHTEEQKNLNKDSLEQHSRELLDKIFDAVDKADIWQCKFTSEYQSRDGNKDSQKDSIYYMTPNGITLRFKMSILRSDGIRGVVQPFMEKALFVNDSLGAVGRLMAGPIMEKNEVSERPEVGKSIVEYLTREFLDLQKSPVKDEIKNFQPSIKVIITDGKAQVVSQKEIGAYHCGHVVHNIESIKK